METSPCGQQTRDRYARGFIVLLATIGLVLALVSLGLSVMHIARPWHLPLSTAAIGSILGACFLGNRSRREKSHLGR